ncbi:MAG: glycoside hydrolase family 127 protein, partial [Lentisphaerae bacterium]|nr:glycoside hydrolase family 127 protein [Lentisphaerota bacterium]
MKTKSQKLGIYNSFSLNEAKINGGFWNERMENNRKKTLPAILDQLEKTGRVEALKQNWKPGQPNRPHIFWDSDTAKVIEGCCYSLATNDDEKLEKKVAEIVDLFASAQQPDGYLNSYFTTIEPGKRWTNLRDNHELYCAGHVIEAAVAHFNIKEDTSFLDIACKYADYIESVFGRKRGQMRGYPGHQEIELALVRLYEATKKKRYLKLAQYFIEERGRKPNYFDKEAAKRGETPDTNNPHRVYEYTQAHLPVREQTKPVGHAVRAVYLYIGMTAVAIATDDKTLLNASRRLWKEMISRYIHISGGIGQTLRNEGFTTAYDLPDESAYLETCASISMALWGMKMLETELNSTYSDVIEQTLYNGILSGVSLDGTKFFYGNPLASYPGFNGNGTFISDDYNYRRNDWFECSCCPTNITRLIAQIPTFLYTANDSLIAVHQYADSEVNFTPNDIPVKIVQETDYPWDGKILISVLPEQTASFTVALRVPGWCKSATLKINGRKPKSAYNIIMGYIRIQRKWEKGDKITLTLSMPVERIEANPNARQNPDRIALKRGPVVYCLESADNGRGLNHIYLPLDPEFEVSESTSGSIKGIPVIKMKAYRKKTPAKNDPLYSPLGSWSYAKCSVTAIPY